VYASTSVNGLHSFKPINSTPSGGGRCSTPKPAEMYLRVGLAGVGEYTVAELRLTAR
jgi:hypothetical protein